MTDAKQSLVRAVDAAVATIKAQPKALDGAKAKLEVRARAVDALDSAMSVAHTQVSTEYEAAQLLKSSMAKYSAAMDDFERFMAGKPPAPKKSAYELKEEQRKKAAAEAKAKADAEEAERTAKIAAFDANTKVVEEPFTDVLGQELTVRYRSKHESVPDMKAVLKLVEDSTRYTIQRKQPHADNALIARYLRTIRVAEYTAHTQLMSAVRILLLHVTLPRPGVTATQRDAQFNEEFDLIWALTDRAYRETAAASATAAASPDVAAALQRKRGAAAAAAGGDDDDEQESPYDDHDAVTDIAFEMLQRKRDPKRIGALVDRTLAQGVAKLRNRQFGTLITAVASLGRWRSMREIGKALPGGLDLLHRMALQGQVPDLAALDKLMAGADGKAPADADEKSLVWSTRVIKRLNVKYRDGRASDPALLAPLQQAAQQMPEGQDMPLGPGALLIRSGAYCNLVSTSGGMAPFVGHCSDTDLRMHAFVGMNGGESVEDYDLKFKSADGPKQTWTGTYVQSANNPKENQTLTATFDVTMELEAASDKEKELVR